MRILEVSPDLVLEIHDDGVVRLVSRDMARDRDPDCAGVVVIYPGEIDSLTSALMEARTTVCPLCTESMERFGREEG